MASGAVRGIGLWANVHRRRQAAALACLGHATADGSAPPPAFWSSDGGAPPHWRAGLNAISSVPHPLGWSPARQRANAAPSI
eukprot:750661-Pyramimonas_sp.AAC.1